MKMRLQPYRESYQASTEPTAGILADPMTLENRVVQALEAIVTGAEVINECRTDDPQDNLDRDAHFSGDSETVRSSLRIWRNRKCIVASRAQANSPCFQSARVLSEAAGWPVAVRRSGGTAVAHGPGVLNVSYIEAFPVGTKPPSLNGAYERLSGVLTEAMALLGVCCDYGPVPGACCDGKYNLRWRGRKLAGTAGFMSRRGDATVSVFHAAIAISASAVEELRAIHRFETALGKPANYRKQAHVSVADILSTQASTCHSSAGQQIRLVSRSGT